MDQKIREFVSVMLNSETNDINENLNEKIIQIEKIIIRKTLHLLESLFIGDKLKWLTLLMIKTPN